MHERHNGFKILRREVERGHTGGRDAVRDQITQLFDIAGANPPVAGKAGSAIGTERIGAVASRTRLSENVLATRDGLGIRLDIGLGVQSCRDEEQSGQPAHEDRKFGHEFKKLRPGSGRAASP